LAISEIREAVREYLSWFHSSWRQANYTALLRNVRVFYALILIRELQHVLAESIPLLNGEHEPRP
jgi:hypothetical protein